MDQARIDSHKLMFHPERVAAWLRGENAAPIYMEVSPSGACNHRCLFCGLDFMSYRPLFLDTGMLKARLTELGEYGLKSIMFAGEGEPLLHRDIVPLAVHTKDAGIDVAFTTNGVLLAGEKQTGLLGVSSWIKVSCNAGTADTYARVHGTQANDFERVFKNLEAAVALREKYGFACTLGVQTLLLPDVVEEIEQLAKRCRDIGLDYIVVKPYSQHPQSNTSVYKDISYRDCEALAEKLEILSDGRFKTVFRLRGMRKHDEGSRPYSRCLGLPFWSYIDSAGNVWGCSVYLGDERFNYGNVNDETFRQIWEGERRKASLEWVAGKLDAGSCRVGCRMDEVNRFLWGLKFPHPHVNFI
jgi:radical SAM protein with 4Fe4S-binding SPASM domain